MKVFFLTIAALAMLPLSAEAKNYSCTFPGFDNPLIFSWDQATGRAVMIGNVGNSDVVPIFSELSNSVSFIEVTPTGNVMTTTILGNGSAVHSRNTVILGELIPSQELGECR